LYVNFCLPQKLWPDNWDWFQFLGESINFGYHN
jgi:hypothetical protein